MTVYRSERLVFLLSKYSWETMGVSGWIQLWAWKGYKYSAVYCTNRLLMQNILVLQVDTHTALLINWYMILQDFCPPILGWTISCCTCTKTKGSPCVLFRAINLAVFPPEYFLFFPNDKCFNLCSFLFPCSSYHRVNRSIISWSAVHRSCEDFGRQVRARDNWALMMFLCVECKTLSA